MTGKEFLEQSIKLNEEIKNDSILEEMLRESALSIPSVNNYSDTATVSAISDKIGAIVAKIVDLENNIKLKKILLEDIKHKIYINVNKLEKSEHKNVLIKRYVDLKDWNVIQKEMNYSNRQIYRFHNKALKEFSKKFV